MLGNEHRPPPLGNDHPDADELGRLRSSTWEKAMYRRGKPKRQAYDPLTGKEPVREFTPKKIFVEKASTNAKAIAWKEASERSRAKVHRGVEYVPPPRRIRGSTLSVEDVEDAVALFRGAIVGESAVVNGISIQDMEITLVVGYFNEEDVLTHWTCLWSCGILSADMPAEKSKSWAVTMQYNYLGRAKGKERLVRSYGKDFPSRREYWILSPYRRLDKITWRLDRVVSRKKRKE